VSLDKGSHEHILNCIHILSEMEVMPCAQEIFSKDAKAAYSKMLGAQEVNALVSSITMIVVVSFFNRLKAARWKYADRRRL